MALHLSPALHFWAPGRGLQRACPLRVRSAAVLPSYDLLEPKGPTKSAMWGRSELGQQLPELGPCPSGRGTWEVGMQAPRNPMWGDLQIEFPEREGSPRGPADGECLSRWWRKDSIHLLVDGILRATAWSRFAAQAKERGAKGLGNVTSPVGVGAAPSLDDHKCRNGLFFSPCPIPPVHILSQTKISTQHYFYEAPGPLPAPRRLPEFDRY